jgi:hypothetical protein
MPPGDEEQNVARDAAEAVAGLTATGAGAAIDPTQPEQTTQTEDPSAAAASAVQTTRTVGTEPPSKKGPKGDITVTGTVDKRYLPGEQVAQQVIAQREQAFTYAVGAAQLQQAMVSEDALHQWSEVTQKDAESARQLVETEFPRYRAAMQQLDDDIDQARKLRVNPHNYMQSVGRSGRVAAVLAVGVGQLAAGAGNPNSVWQRQQAAMERDINAQKANIDLVYKGISAKRQLTQDELNLLEQQLNFTDRARAVGYSALAAKVGAAKQHATTETIRANLEMVETRALAASIEASAQARAKAATFMLEARVHSISAAIRKAEKLGKVAEAQALRDMQREGLGERAAIAAAGLEPLDGVVTGPGTGAPVPVQGAPVEGPAPTQPAAAPPVQPTTAAGAHPPGPGSSHSRGSASANGPCSGPR